MRSEGGATDRARRRRLAWGCRRGMLELDALLAPVAQRVESLDPDRVDALGALLDRSDGELWDLFVAGSRGPEDVLDEMVGATRQSGRTRKREDGQR